MTLAKLTVRLTDYDGKAIEVTPGTCSNVWVVFQKYTLKNTSDKYTCPPNEQFDVETKNTYLMWIANTWKSDNHERRYRVSAIKYVFIPSYATTQEVVFNTLLRPCTIYCLDNRINRMPYNMGTTFKMRLNVADNSWMEEYPARENIWQSSTTKESRKIETLGSICIPVALYQYDEVIPLKYRVDRKCDSTWIEAHTYTMVNGGPDYQDSINIIDHLHWRAYWA